MFYAIVFQLAVYDRTEGCVCLSLNVRYTDSHLLFKATDFGLAVCQLERQTLGCFFTAATLKSRG